MARSILVTETDEEASDYLSDDRSSYGWYYAYLRDNLAENTSPMVCVVVRIKWSAADARNNSAFRQFKILVVELPTIFYIRE